MIDVQQAVQLIRQASQPLETESIAVVDALGRVTAGPVCADLDAPPFDKSMMDGFAVAAADITAANTNFAVIDSLAAGQTPGQALRPGTAIQIMTGATLPPRADAVVMLEDASFDAAAKTVTIRATSVRPGQNILRQGSVFRRGNQLFAAGHRILAHDVGLLAEAGASPLIVRRIPSVAVIATGNEICDPEEMPGPGKIRNSNGPLLVNLVRAQQGLPLYLGGVGDDEQELANACYRGMAADVLILTGGVSTGMLDLVPRVLKSLNVEQVFHKVSLKPGKPVWFGLSQSGEHRCLVFGLPGNPVSSFVCFHLFVREGLAALAGQDASGDPSQREAATRAYLTQAHEIRGDRPTYWPSRLQIDDGRATVQPLDWKGSADQRCLTRANCLAVFPEGNRTYSANDLIEVRWLV